MNAEKYNYVNAFINNVSFPQTVEQFEDVVHIKGCYDIEHLLIEAEEDGEVCWTSPRNSVIGDVVLYFHAKSAIQKIKKIERDINKLDSSVDEDYKAYLLWWIDRAKDLYSLFGAKIFAIGRISGRPEREDDLEFEQYWGSRIYADVSDLYILDNPIDFEEFNSFIYLARQSAITPLPSKEFEGLKELIRSKNPNVPNWFLESKIGDNMLSKVNQNNFIEFTSSYRKRFPLEISFRSYYVDYFLKVLSGNKVYRECPCCIEGLVKQSNPRIDNIFEFNGKKILLEVKLNIDLEKDLISQLNQYIFADYIYLEDKKTNKITDFEKEYMFVIDVYSVYKYNVKEKGLIKLFDLDEIKSKEDIIIKMQEHICF
jgi:hypothetical protein